MQASDRQIQFTDKLLNLLIVNMNGVPLNFGNECGKQDILDTGNAECMRHKSSYDTHVGKKIRHTLPW